MLRSVSATDGRLRYACVFTLKDHLGTLRLAYRAGQRTASMALLEVAREAQKQQRFDSASVSAPMVQSVACLPDPPATSGTRVAVLNAAPHPLLCGGTVGPTPLGPLKQLAVQKGGTVSFSAWACHAECR